MTRRPTPALRARTAVGVAVGLALVAGLALGPGPSSQAQRPAPSQAPAAAQVWAEVDAMIANGVSRNDPKVRMLEADARALEAAAAAPPRVEPGVDRNAVAALADEGAIARTPAEARARASEMRSNQPAVLGTVLCEPIPQLLSAREVSGATCYSVPQVDGTSRYVAVTPDGRVLVVRFAAAGDVRRLPDTRLPAGTSAAHATADAAGNLTVAPPGEPVTSVDLG